MIGITVVPNIRRLLNTSKALIASSERCHSPSVRNEWRSLNQTQQNNYITAVKCLMTLPSVFEQQTSIYDDFVYVHTQSEAQTHYAAAFLAWHRYYIHLYETALRNSCGYDGNLV